MRWILCIGRHQSVKCYSIQNMRSAIYNCETTSSHKNENAFFNAWNDQNSYKQGLTKDYLCLQFTERDEDDREANILTSARFRDHHLENTVCVHNAF